MSGVVTKIRIVPFEPGDFGYFCLPGKTMQLSRIQSINQKNSF
jgi:hypothetical protein